MTDKGVFIGGERWSIFETIDVAKKFGMKEKALRRLARDLGACRVLGRRMVLLAQDVAAIHDYLHPEEARAALLEATISAAINHPTPTTMGNIYFISYKDRVKIGFATDVAERFANIQAMSPVPLTLLASYKGTWREEQALHVHFAPTRIHGEWFIMTQELEDYIFDVPKMARLRLPPQCEEMTADG